LKFVTWNYERGFMAEQKQEQASSGGGGKIRIQYYRSFIAFPKTQKEIVRSLGLTKLNQIVERPDNASTRGVVQKVPHLIRIIE
jgi:large subunit ribosomal protein L30